jgi:hypothetical protein
MRVNVNKREWEWHRDNYAQIGDHWEWNDAEDHETLQECIDSSMSALKNKYHQHYIYRINGNDIVTHKFTINDARRILKLNQL